MNLDKLLAQKAWWCYAVDILKRRGMMTPVVQDFLTTFDRLTDSEQLDLASEILKRTAYLYFPPLSDEDLVLNGEDIFLQLDESGL
jgi:hypothetical protein